MNLTAREIDKAEAQKALNLICNGDTTALKAIGIVDLQLQIRAIAKLTRRGAQLDMVDDNNISLLQGKIAEHIIVASQLPHHCILQKLLDEPLNRLDRLSATEAETIIQNIGDALLGALEQPSRHIQVTLLEATEKIHSRFSSERRVPQLVNTILKTCINHGASNINHSLTDLVETFPELFAPALKLILQDEDRKRKDSTVTTVYGFATEFLGSNPIRMATLIILARMSLSDEDVYRIFPDFVAIRIGMTTVTHKQTDETYQASLLQHLKDETGNHSPFEKASAAHTLNRRFNYPPFQLSDMTNDSVAKQLIVEDILNSGRM